MAISFRILRPYPARHVSAGGAPCGDLIGLVRATDSFPVRVCRKPTRDTKEFLLQCLAPISGHRFFKGLFLSSKRISANESGQTPVCSGSSFKVPSNRDAVRRDSSARFSLISRHCSMAMAFLFKTPLAQNRSHSYLWRPRNATLLESTFRFWVTRPRPILSSWFSAKPSFAYLPSDSPLFIRSVSNARERTVFGNKPSVKELGSIVVSRPPRASVGNFRHRSQ